jgi:hypothetical protein
MELSCHLGTLFLISQIVRQIEPHLLLTSKRQHKALYSQSTSLFCHHLTIVLYIIYAFAEESLNYQRISPPRNPVIYFALRLLVTSNITHAVEEVQLRNARLISQAQSLENSTPYNVHKYE